MKNFGGSVANWIDCLEHYRSFAFACIDRRQRLFGTSFEHAAVSHNVSIRTFYRAFTMYLTKPILPPACLPVDRATRIQLSPSAALIHPYCSLSLLFSQAD